MSDGESNWLRWARELQALSQSGLTFTRDPYDRERYERLRAMSAEIFQLIGGGPIEQIEALFANQTGYATPKIDVRAAVFDDHDQLLMVREKVDENRWALPGGWADVNLTPAENIVKEVFDESGYEISVTKLAAVWDRTRQKHPEEFFSCYKMFSLCELEGGAATTGIETSEVAWFKKNLVPTDLSFARVLPSQIKKMFTHRRKAKLSTDFD